MSIIGSVDSLWRYPVKSMRGQELEQAYLGFAGVYGDRLFAFKSPARPAGFPYLTAREQQTMLQYQPQFRHPERTLQPLNLPDAEKITPGLTPVYGDSSDLAVDVVTPDGQTLSIDDPALIQKLLDGLKEDSSLTLLRSDRAMTDCRPVSLFSLQSARQLGEEMGATVDPRRFRANIYLDLDSAGGFGEDSLVGKTIRIGQKVTLRILERDPRCKMISLAPDTGASRPEYLRQVTKAHDGMAGVYGAVLAEGMVQKGDTIQLLD